jgi:hypothetical protein
MHMYLHVSGRPSSCMRLISSLCVAHAWAAAITRMTPKCGLLHAAATAAGVREMASLAGDGAVAVLAFLQTSPDTPSEVLTAAAARLTSSSGSMHDTGRMPAAWSALEAASVADDAAELVLESGSRPLMAGSVGGGSRLSAAATAGVV